MVVRAVFPVDCRHCDHETGSRTESGRVEDCM